MMVEVTWALFMPEFFSTDVMDVDESPQGAC